MKRFLRNSILFLAGLIAAAALLDARVGRSIRSEHGYINGRPLVGREIYRAQENADQPGPQVRTLYLGDSISRQLFPPRLEPSPRVRYVCSNQAVSLAGQYYLLERALRHCPNAREVILFYFPLSWGNDLPWTLSHDYYCGYFHSPSEIWQTFKVTRDCDLLAAHLGHWALPNLLAANTVSRPAAVALSGGAAPGDAGMAPPPADPEPLLTALTDLCRAGSPRTAAVGPGGIPLSTVSHAFLPRMRALCTQRSIALRILSSPCSNAKHFDHPGALYDAPILYVDRAELQEDGIHFQNQFLKDARRQIVDFYHLQDAPLPDDDALGGADR